jgi:endonuclease YncB( thermonuclease family)
LAIEARDLLKWLLDEADQILVYTEDGRGKYGRWIVEVVCDGINAGDVLIAAGLARRYDGGTKDSEPW